MFTLLTIFFPFIAAACIPLLYRYFKKIQIGWFVFAVPFTLFIYLLSLIPNIKKGEVLTYAYEWIPTFNIQFTTYIDGLSMIFGLLITGIGSLVVFYSIFYLSSKESLHHFYIYLLLFMGAMLGVVFSDHLLVLYTFWELTSVSSFLLIAFWHHRKASRAGARKAMTITVIGGVSMLAGFLMLATMADTYSIRELFTQVELLAQHQLFIPAMLCILLGAFTKSAQFPFHIWLPDAMEAPTPVSAYLHSATMVKAGIYLVARMTPIFGIHELWFWIVSSVGIFTLFWGSFHAVRQYDLKGLLAYSTVSQLGLIMSLFGLGSIAWQLGYSKENIIYTQATFTALFHLINHSTFKGALFMVVGIIDHEVGTRDIRRLGGLMHFMPITFTIALIGSLSMAGLPPFNGFLSKEMFFVATLNIMDGTVFAGQGLTVVFPVLAWIASIFTFLYCIIILGKTFFGKTKLERLEKPPHEAPFGMLIPPFILVSLVVLIFLFPNVLANNILAPAMLSMYPNYAPVEELVPHIYAWHGFKTELFMTIGVVIVGSILYRYLVKVRKAYAIFIPQFTFNDLYESVISGAENASGKMTKRYMTGNLTHYFIYIYLAFIFVVAGYFIAFDAMAIPFDSSTSIAFYEVLLVLIMIIAALAILFAKKRVTVVLLNGVLGYSVAFFFVIFRAPDLALTQLVVESVTTALFLISFKFLPGWTLEKVINRTGYLKVAISIAVGATVTAIGLAVLNYEEFTNISSYYENSYELAGGKNIVNTILGDFRAFDTMLEVVVLFIAGLGIYTLIKLKAKKEDVDIEDQ